MLNQSYFIELLRQSFTDLHPKYVVQCCGGDAVKAPQISSGISPILACWFNDFISIFKSQIWLNLLQHYKIEKEEEKTLSKTLKNYGNFLEE